MVAEVINTIKKHNLLLKGDTVVTALSGGADSMALLFFLLEIKEEYRLKLYALHVNHMLRGLEAERDERFVKEYCERQNIELLVYYKDVKSLADRLKISVEEAGRAARFEAYDDARLKLCANKIAVAHNKNDQAETFLLRLARGAGTNGLRCMEYKRGSVIRPFLDCGRKEIELYAKENNIPFVTDSTNNEDIYDRNKVRHGLIPWLAANLNPNIINTIVNTNHIIKEQTDYLNAQALLAYEQCLHDEASHKVILNREPIKRFDAAIKKLVIRQAVSRICPLKDITAAHINSILDILDKQTGKKAVLPKEIVCEVVYGFLVIKKQTENMHISYELKLNKKAYIAEKHLNVLISDDGKIVAGNLKNLCTKEVKCDKILFKAHFRTRLPGDRIRLSCGTKKIKKYFIDEKVPREERDAACLITINDEVVSILNMVDAITNGQYTYYVNTWEDTDGEY